MIEHGVALMRLATNPCGVAMDKLTFEEFYVVVSKGRILQSRFESYAAAFNHAERLLRDVA